MNAQLRDILDKVKWPALFCLWILHGLIATWQFTDNSLKVSLPYLFIFCFLLFWIVICFFLVVLDVKNVTWWMRWKVFSCKPRVRDLLFVASFLLMSSRIGLWYLQGLLIGDSTLRIGGYLNILNPVLNLLAYVSVEIVILNLAFYIRDIISHRKSLQSFFVCLVVLFSIMGMMVIIISQTGLGIRPAYQGDWQRGLPAVPLLEWQILLAGILCLGMLIFEAKKRVIAFPRFDILLCFAIWAGASIIWLSQPVIPSASALAPHEPNFEIYPFIDSQTYDELSQSILIGNGFGGEQIPQRPLYIAFLAFIHILVGQDYSHVIFVQTLVFAFFPVLLFLLGRDLFGRPIGVSIALLAILRDYTSNIVSPFAGNLSYSKVYLSEIPTAMLLILFLIIGIRWIRSGFPIYLGFFLGGILGLAMLVRTQVVVVVPVILFFSILSRPRKIRPLVKSVVVMLVFAGIMVSPWLWRNWNITGDLIFDNPESQTMNLALRYSRVNGMDGQVDRLPGETSAEFSDRLKKIAMDAILSNPAGAAWALASSFVNHGINNILLFPLRNEVGSFDELVFPSEAFWEKWEGTPTSSQSILLGFYIFLFSLGVAVAWMRSGWLGLLPLGLNLIYNLWTSIALLSGQRFMLTMDWSIYFYYMTAVFTLIGCFLFILNSTRTLIVKWVESNPFILDIPFADVRWPKFLIVGMLFFSIGISLPLAEKIFPEKYPHLPQGQLTALLVRSASPENSPVNSSCLKKLINDQQLRIVQGRALYPRYYSAGDGEDFTDTPGYKTVEVGRLVFDIIGQENHRVIFPMPQSPDFFPHASDVTLLSNQNGEIWFILVSREQTEKLYVSDDFDGTLCQ